jgi:hypothetical protein
VFDGSLECDEANCPDLPTSSIDILYSTTDDIGGFQFDITGVTILSASGGAAGSAGFMVSANATTVIGFSLTGATIPAGTGVLTVVEVEGLAEDACVDNVVFSDASGGLIETQIDECLTISQLAAGVPGCMDDTACNYDSGATEDDGSCDYGTECWDGSFECDEADCPDIPTSTIEVLYNTTEDMGGFQFMVSGVTVTSATAGDNVPSDWSISAANGTVLGTLSPAVALVTVTPLTINWKPPISSVVLYNTSMVLVGMSGQSASSHSKLPSQHSVP